MITQQFKIQRVSQSNETGEPAGELTLAPVAPPNDPTRMTPREVRRGHIHMADIPLEQLTGLTLGSTVTVTVSAD